MLMYSAFPRPWSGRVSLTSLRSYAFFRPCVGRIEYLLVHGLDVLKSLFNCPRFLPRLVFGRVCLVMKGIPAFHLCRLENFLVHGLVDLNKNLNKSNMEIMHSHNTMYIT